MNHVAGGVRIDIIGALRVTTLSGRDVSPRGRKVQALLGVLALADGEPVVRGRLSGLLWGNVPEKQARESLRQALHQLSSDLGEDAARLLCRDSGRDALWIDIAACTIDARTVLEQLHDGIATEVLGRCDRPLLEGLDGINQELDQLLQVERGRFESRLQAALAADLSEMEARGAPPESAIAAAERLALVDPASELAARALMRAHAAAGDRAAGLRAFRRCEEALRSRLDVGPSRETAAFAEALKRFAGDAPRAAITLPAQHPIEDAGAGRAGDALLVDRPLIPAIGFIPFDDRMSDPGHDALGELIAEEAIAELSGSGLMRVISRLSTSAVRGRGLRVDEIGNLLGSNFVVSGTYRVVGDHVEARVELADCVSQEHIWTEPVRGRMADILVPHSPFIQQICTGIADALAARARRRVHRVPLPSLEGFSLQLGAITLMHQTNIAEFKRSRQILDHLIERYPGSPEPRAWLAKWHVLQVSRGYVAAPDANASEALEHTQRALDSSPDCSLALAMEGFVHCHMNRDLDRADRALRQALAMNPNESLAWLFSGVVHAFRGKANEALVQTHRAIELSPLDPLRHYYDALGSTAALAAEQFDQAIEMATRALRANAAHLPTLRALAIAQVGRGAVEAARETAKRILEFDPDFNLRDYVAKVPRGGESLRIKYAAALREAGIPDAPGGSASMRRH